MDNSREITAKIERQVEKSYANIIAQINNGAACIKLANGDSFNCAQSLRRADIEYLVAENTGMGISPRTARKYLTRIQKSRQAEKRNVTPCTDNTSVQVCTMIAKK